MHRLLSFSLRGTLQSWSTAQTVVGKRRAVQEFVILLQILYYRPSFFLFFSPILGFPVFIISIDNVAAVADCSTSPWTIGPYWVS